MSSFDIQIDLSDILAGADVPLQGNAFPNLAVAVERIIQAAQDQWVAFAQGEPLPDGQVIKSRSGAYRQSILARELGEFSGEVYSELPYAEGIETGFERRDMKKMLDTSLKVRLTKSGKRFLIIPFRHDSPGSVTGNAMPQAVANWWRQGPAVSSITSVYLRPPRISAMPRALRMASTT